MSPASINAKHSNDLTLEGFSISKVFRTRHLDALIQSSILIDSEITVWLLW